MPGCFGNWYCVPGFFFIVPVERYLTERRKNIDRKYDTRGSRLKDVLGRPLYENRLREEDLSGLRDEKMKSISFAQFLREDATRTAF